MSKTLQRKSAAERTQMAVTSRRTWPPARRWQECALRQRLGCETSVATAQRRCSWTGIRGPAIGSRPPASSLRTSSSRSRRWGRSGRRKVARHPPPTQQPPRRAACRRNGGSLRSTLRRRRGHNAVSRCGTANCLCDSLDRAAWNVSIVIIRIQELRLIVYHASCRLGLRALRADCSSPCNQQQR